MDNAQRSESQEQDQQPSTQQNQNELYLIPFVQLEGLWTLSDVQLREVWRQIEEQGLVRTVFWEGHVETFEEFLDFCKNGKVLNFVGCGDECVAFAWLAPISGNHAFGHFCMFKSIWGKRTLEVSRMIFDTWWSYGDNELLDVVFGVVPTSNARAITFMRKMGMELMGEVPGLFKAIDGRRDDGVIGFITRDDYYG